MGVRVVLAGIVGGLLIFTGGFVEHMVLGWVGRQYTPVEMEKEKAAQDFVAANFPKPGIYGVPWMAQNLPADQQEKAMKDLNERYRKGPNATFIVAPSGEDAFGPKQLVGEAVTNIVAALFAAFILAHVRPDVGFVRRWFLAFLFGPLSWVSINASYLLWYRYPQGFVLDELFCAMLEWAVGGLAIAAIVKGKAPAPGI